MEAPTIIIDGKKHRAIKPKVRLWRKIVEFNKLYSKLDDFHSNLDAYDAMLNLLRECFGNPDITSEAIEENLDLSELMPKFIEVTNWVAALLESNAQQIPGKN